MSTGWRTTMTIYERSVERHKGLPPILWSVPCHRKDDTRSGEWSPLGELECLSEDAQLLFRIAWRPDRISERQIGERKPWDANLVEDVAS